MTRSVSTNNLQIPRAIFYLELKKNIIYHPENYNETGSTNNSNLKEPAQVFINCTNREPSLGIIESSKNCRNHQNRRKPRSLMIKGQKSLDFLYPSFPKLKNTHIFESLYQWKDWKMKQREKGRVPLVKQYWKPALSTSLALRPSKQAGPWWTPGNSRICRSAFAGGFLSPKQAVTAWKRLEAVKRVLGFDFLVWVLMGGTKEPFLKLGNGKEWAWENGLLGK